MSELERIKAQIIAQFNPLQILLFGSQAKGTATPKSD
ncbi:MAG: nucleotidyltransferase domain-containing protein, partial [Pseudoflavonifractor sp.]